MTANVVTATPSTSAYDAACLMTKKNIVSLVIVEGGELRGVLTEWDILKRIALKGTIEGAKVSDLMTRDVITITPDTRIANAAETMIERGLRFLPVVDGLTVVGVVTVKDLIFEMNSPTAKGKVSDYMGRAAKTVPSSTKAAEVVRMMIDSKMGCIIVKDGKNIIGVVTKSDILRNSSQEIRAMMTRQCLR
ncbi:MAG: CBS domain-containing protein [Candidatus Altiarchaeota archaeon]